MEALSWPEAVRSPSLPSFGRSSAAPVSSPQSPSWAPPRRRAFSPGRPEACGTTACFRCGSSPSSCSPGWVARRSSDGGPTGPASPRSSVSRCCSSRWPRPLRHCPAGFPFLYTGRTAGGSNHCGRIRTIAAPICRSPGLPPTRKECSAKRPGPNTVRSSQRCKPCRAGACSGSATRATRGSGHRWR